jgi:hypothetical protein
VECCAVVFPPDTVAFFPEGQRWEFDRYARTTFGRDRVFAPDDRAVPDLPMLNRSASRLHCDVRFVDDQWLLEDLGSPGGTFVNGRRLLAPTPVTHGDGMDIPCIARFERFRRTRLLDHVVAAGPWTLYGLDRPLSPGVWPALRCDGGDVVRGTAIVRSPGRLLRPAIVPEAREIVGPYVVDIYPGVGGVPLAALPHQNRLDTGVAAHILEALALINNDDAEALIDFDGRVHAIPAMRHHANAPLPILREAAGRARGGSREDVAATMRGLLPDAWLLEEQLRDELAVLTPDALQRWRDAASIRPR